MFKPPEPLTVSEWADKNRILAREESPTSGKWNTENSPYLRAIMDTFTDNTTQITTFLKPSQVGATEAGINICGYTVDYNPCRLLYVMPDEELAKDFSVDRLQKSLKQTPSIKKKLAGADRSKALAVRFPGGFIRLTGSNSPGKLASWAIPRVIMDEVDKYPQWAGREASPVSLVKERTKNWPWRKILVMSTPTTEYGYVYKSYMDSEIHYKYHVPCPECGHYQEFKFKNLKFPDVLNDERLARETYYQCEQCGHHIKDGDKLKMLRKGKWIPDEQLSYKPKSVGFRLNTIYSPWVRFYEVAKEFLTSKDEPPKLMNFVNSWLGEPWKSKVSMIKSRAVLERKTNIKSGIVPKGTILLTGGVDCQQGYFYWVIRAWQKDMKSQKIANGSAVTFDDVKNIMDRNWQIEDSDETMQVVLYAVDSGYHPEEVYDFCYTNFPVSVPVMGLSRPIAGYFRRKQLTPSEYRNARGQGNVLYEVDTNKYKDLIAYRLSKNLDEKGSWTVDADTDSEYADMITAEQKVIVDGKEVWKEISSARPNHYLDCEVYAYVAADVMNIKSLSMTTGEANAVDTNTGEVYEV